MSDGPVIEAEGCWVMVVTGALLVLVSAGIRAARHLPAHLPAHLPPAPVWLAHAVRQPGVVVTGVGLGVIGMAVLVVLACLECQQAIKQATALECPPAGPTGPPGDDQACVGHRIGRVR